LQHGYKYPFSMRKIVLLGAGRSSRWLQVQLAKTWGSSENITVGDVSLPQKQEANVLYIAADLTNEEELLALISGAFAVVSLLPPDMHLKVARLCIGQCAHFLSASYETEAMRELGPMALEAKVALINECGLDPGIDHATASSMLALLKQEGATITAFESYCGGLPANQTINDYGYTFFWNPLNVVRAGGDGALFQKEGQPHLVPYHKVFDTPWAIEPSAVIQTKGEFEAYPNRDSLSYIPLYGLEGINTFVRGTIRYADFCKKWRILVDAGATNQTLKVPIALTFGEYVNLFDQPSAKAALLELALESGVDLESSMGVESSDMALHKLLLQVWSPKSGAHDRVVMYHKISYLNLDSLPFYREFWMDIEGDDSFSAMARTVGGSLYITLKALLEGAPYVGNKTPIDADLAGLLVSNLPHIGIIYKETNVALHV
jgi:saccharopine dehydrogenase-like NADP-dependent oxidoreductase